jgi:hypothetical protein
MVFLRCFQFMMTGLPMASHPSLLYSRLPGLGIFDVYTHYLRLKGK